MDRRKEIISGIEGMVGEHSAFEIFDDWIKCLAISIQNGCYMVKDKTWEEREKEYIGTVKKYKKDDFRKMAEMTEMLIETMDELMHDILGDIYMSLSIGNKHIGQFFTPYHLSKLCAKSMLSHKEDDGKIYINEPSCGAGGMIIAAAETLKEKGINYQKKLEVTAQDLDWKAVYMCYVQLSLYGISAICVQGNTLSEPYVKRQYPEERVLRTPRKMGAII